jgi:hypothetical protein
LHSHWWSIIFASVWGHESFSYSHLCVRSCILLWFQFSFSFPLIFFIAFLFVRLSSCVSSFVNCSFSSHLKIGLLIFSLLFLTDLSISEVQVLGHIPLPWIFF